MIPVTFFSFSRPFLRSPNLWRFVPVEERSDGAPSHSGFPALTPPSSFRGFADPCDTVFPVVLMCLCHSTFTYHLFQDQLNLELRRCVGRRGSLSCHRLFSEQRVFQKDGASLKQFLSDYTLLEE